LLIEVTSLDSIHQAAGRGCAPMQFQIRRRRGGQPPLAISEPTGNRASSPSSPNWLPLQFLAWSDPVKGKPVALEGDFLRE